MQGGRRRGGGSFLCSPTASPLSPRSPSPSEHHRSAESERSSSRSETSRNHFIIRHYREKSPASWWEVHLGGAINIVKRDPSVPTTAGIFRSAGRLNWWGKKEDFFFTIKTLFFFLVYKRFFFDHQRDLINLFLFMPSALLSASVI